MNSSLWMSKKFRASVIAATTALLTFLVTKLGLQWDIEEIMTLVTTLVAPFLMYVGAEGYSEQLAKQVLEEQKNRKDVDNNGDTA